MATPNILLITTDQQRYDTCGPAKPGPWLRTPHLDQLARRGIWFNRAYTDCPICVPARCTILTGRHAFRHGMMSNRASSEVLGSTDTLPWHLGRLNYQTLGVGKMHFEPERARHGFDECLISSDYHHAMLCSGHPMQPMRHGLGQCEMVPGMNTVPEALSYTNWTTEQCVQFIRARRDPTRPFFLWCSYAKPHPPFDPCEPYYSMYRDPTVPIPSEVIGDWVDADSCPVAFTRYTQRQNYDTFDADMVRNIRAAYYGLITQIDYSIGRLLAALHDTGQMDNTLVLFTADHGEFLCDHRSGGKIFFHEPAAHVPFIYVPPRGTDEARRGTRSDQLVCLADLLPTLVSAAGGSPSDLDGRVDGRDILAVERGQAQPRHYLEGTAHDFPDDPNWYWAITDGRWKYTWYPEGPAEQLFDLRDDPHETTNLAGSDNCAAEKERLRCEMVRRHTARGSDAVDDGRMKARPPVRQGDSERERRSRMWQGLHTEYLNHDVQH